MAKRKLRKTETKNKSSKVEMKKKIPKTIISNELTFTKQNYILSTISLFMIIVGFVVMSVDQTTFGFGLLGLTVGPLIVLAGFIMIIFSILHKPKQP